MVSKKILDNLEKNRAWLDRRNEEGIEKYRKGDFSIEVPKGVSSVHVKQIKHDFLFGSTVFMLNSFEKPEKETIYKEKFSKIFNQGVVPFYWGDLEPTEGTLRFAEDSAPIYRRPPIDTALRFCREYGIEPKGHCLAWNNALPSWLENYSPKEREALLEKRFAEIAEAYADKIPSWDIVNESASNYYYGAKRLFENYEEKALLLGAKYFPHNRKIINETNDAIWRDYFGEGKYMAFNMQLADLARRNFVFDEIGLQFHIFCPSEDMEQPRLQDKYLNFENMVDILKIYNDYQKPLHISEITIPGSGKDAQNEEVQATLVEAFYKTWFATEQMKSIVWWNLADGYAAYAPLGTDEGENRCGGGLLRFDMSEKPAYQVLDRLINHEWRTEQDVFVKDGKASFRGFYGTYEITVNGKTEIKRFSK